MKGTNSQSQTISFVHYTTLRISASNYCRHLGLLRDIRRGLDWIIAFIAPYEFKIRDYRQ
jgi:hypothetical protein